MRKVIGVIILTLGVVGLLLSIAGIVIGLRFVDSAVQGANSSIELALQSLSTVEESLVLTKTTVSQMNDALVTVEETADNISQAVRETQPLLDQISSVTTGNVPDSLEAVQEAIPNLVEVAGVIDKTLKTLSEFNVNQNLGLFTLNFDLGIDYDPEQPFDESVAALGSSLEGVPGQLRGLDTYMAVSSDNLSTISRDMMNLADDINAINESVAEIVPLIDDYIAIVQELETNIQALEPTVETKGRNVKIGLVVVLVWFALYQIVPLYMGWNLVTTEDQQGEN